VGHSFPSPLFLILQPSSWLRAKVHVKDGGECPPTMRSGILCKGLASMTV